MTTSSQRLPLRILYTINSSPQYILAKSPSAYPVEIIQTDPSQHGVAHIYASTALKHCLHTICRSSPELVQDNSRDFSVYVLDPLESNSAPAPVHISNSSKSADASSDNIRGVAVGFGLMSWALRSEDDLVKAVGTLVKSSGSESLEVVFALRETVSKTFPIWNTPTTVSHQISQFVNTMSSAQQNAIASSSSAVTSPEYRTSVPATKPQRSSRAEPKSRARVKKPVPTTGSDRLLDAPDVYIGPQKKKGRPRVTKVNGTSELIAGKAKAEAIVIDYDPRTRFQATPGASTSRVAHSNSFAISPPQLSTSTGVQSTQVKTEPDDNANMLQILNLLSGGSPESEAQKAVILAALDSIDSTPESDANSNPLLIAALKQLVNMCANSSRPQGTVPQHAQPPTTPLNPPLTNQPAHDDEIVILDKENVDPIVFNKKKRDYLDVKFQAMAGPSSGSQSAPPTRVPSLTFRSRSNGVSPPRALSRSNSAASVNGPRKRTLSDFMEERDNNRNKDRPRERTERRDPQRHNFFRPESPADAFRHYRTDSGLPNSDNPLAYYRTALEPWTSPVRSKDDAPDPYLADSETKGPEPSLIRSPIRPQKAAASSPVRGASANLSKKKYIVPAWARTSTATQPRLSEEAQQALKDAEERKQQERRENRKKSGGAQERAKRKRERDGRSAPTSSSTSSVAQSRSSSSTNLPLPPTRGPLVAAANVSPLAALFSSPRRRSPSPSERLPFPQTPTRPRASGYLTSGGLGDSLFTPVSKTGSIFGSARTPLFSPEVGYGPSGSPLNRKKIRTSPKTPMYLPVKRPNFNIHITANSSKELSDELVDINSDLDKELDAAFEDLDAPPSSLPTASSDTEIDDAFSLSNESAMPSSSQTAGDEDDSEQPPQKEIWDGLPPSSPPPPSSPSLLPLDTNDEDMEDLELPVATSDIESEFTDFDGTFSASEEGQMFSEEELTLAGNDFSTFFAFQQGSDQPMQSDDMFDQFTHINAQSDGHLSDEAITNMGVGDLDFSAFWETFSPLLEGNMVSASATVEDAGVDGLGFDFTEMKSSEELDHEGLAQDVKNLLSGCVV